jgi:hypothetical protein
MAKQYIHLKQVDTLHTLITLAVDVLDNGDLYVHPTHYQPVVPVSYLDQ